MQRAGLRFHAAAGRRSPVVFAACSRSAGAPRAAASSSSTTATTSRSRRRSPTTRCCRSFRSSCCCSRSLSRLAVSAGNERRCVDIVARALPQPLRLRDRPQIEELANAPLQLSVLGTIVTLWASMGVFGAVTSAVNHAWGVEKPLRLLQAQAHRVRHADGGRRAAAGGARAASASSQVAQARWFAGVMQRVAVARSTRRASSYRNVADADVHRRRRPHLLLRAERAGAAPRRLVRRDPGRPAVAPRVRRVLLVRPRSLAIQRPRLDRRGRRVSGVGVSVGGDPAVRRGGDRGVRAACASSCRRAPAPPRLQVPEITSCPIVSRASAVRICCSTPNNPVDWYPVGRRGVRRGARARTSRSSCRSATRRATGAT